MGGHLRVVRRAGGILFITKGNEIMLTTVLPIRGYNNLNKSNRN